MTTPNRIISAALKSETLTSEERFKLEDMEIYCSNIYCEPGYSTQHNWVVVGDFNPSDSSNGGGFERACDMLERICALEWFDEWATCDECGKLVRTSPDSYHYTPFYHITESAIVCLDCLDHAEYLEEILNNPLSACMPGVDPEQHGFTLYVGGFESGFYGTMDDPKKIAEKIPAGLDYVFKLDSSSQFAIQFSVYVRDNQED